MSRYSFNSYTDDSVYDEEGNTTIYTSFETDSLDTIVEKFYWFLKACGYDYVDEVTAGGASFRL
jgi:hypothetical protein